jgi:hypothetical protein
VCYYMSLLNLGQKSWFAVGSEYERKTQASYGIAAVFSMSLQRKCWKYRELDESPILSRGTMSIDEQHEVLSMLGLAPKKGLAELLRETKCAMATDERDQVYALLGLAAESEDRNFLTVSYKEDVGETYRRVAKKLLLQKKGISLLYDCSGPKNLLNLPSWTPDWSSKPFGVLLRDYQVTAVDNPIYSACALTKPSLQFSDNNELLIVRGCIVDRLTAVGNAFKIDPSPNDIILTLNCAWEAEARDLALAATQYSPGADHFEAFWRTMIGNRAYYGGKAPPEYAELYRAHLQRLLQFDPRTRGPDESLDVELYVELSSRARPFHLACQTLRHGRRFCVTQKGFMGLAGQLAKEGDEIAILLGAGIPFVIRKGEHGRYSIVGDCYIHGIMEGEALAMDEWNVKDIVIA